MPDVIYRINGGALTLLANQTSPVSIPGTGGDSVEVWLSDKKTATVLGGGSGAEVESISTGYAGSNGALATSMAITNPTGATTGDLVVVYAFHSDNWNTVTLSATVGTGWSKSTQGVFANHRSAVFSKVLTGTGDALTVGADFSGLMAYVAVRISNPGTFFAGTFASAAGTTVYDPGALDAGSSAERIWMTAVCTFDPRVPNEPFTTWPTGYTDNQTSFFHPTGHYSHPVVGFATRTATAQTENPSAWGRTGGGNRDGLTWTSAVTV